MLVVSAIRKTIFTLFLALLVPASAFAIGLQDFATDVGDGATIFSGPSNDVPLGIGSLDSIVVPTGGSSLSNGGNFFTLDSFNVGSAGGVLDVKFLGALGLFSDDNGFSDRIFLQKVGDGGLIGGQITVLDTLLVDVGFSAVLNLDEGSYVFGIESPQGTFYSDADLNTANGNREYMYSQFVDDEGLFTFVEGLGGSKVSSFLTAGTMIAGFEDLRLRDRLYDGDAQDVIVAFNFTENEIPEPATVFLLGAGLMGLRRRKRS